MILNRYIDMILKFANFTPKSKVKISKIVPNYSLRFPQLQKHSKRFFRKSTLQKNLQKENLTTKTDKVTEFDIR